MWEAGTQKDNAVPLKGPMASLLLDLWGGWASTSTIFFLQLGVWALGDAYSSLPAFVLLLSHLFLPSCSSFALPDWKLLQTIGNSTN